MSDTLQDQLADLDAYIQSLNEAERARHKAKTANDPQKVFDLIQLGDTVGVAVALQDNRIRPDLTDEHDMTLLHRAAAHDTQLIGAVVMREVSPAPWMRDEFDRLPLDVAREAGHDDLGNQLQSITYPELFRDDTGGSVSTDLIKEYEVQCRTLNKPDTSPPYARDLKPKSKPHRRLKRQRRDKSIER